MLRYVIEATVPGGSARVYTEERCPACNGDGQGVGETVDCRVCSGTGALPDRKLAAETVTLHAASGYARDGYRSRGVYAPAFRGSLLRDGWIAGPWVLPAHAWVGDGFRERCSECGASREGAPAGCRR